MADRNGYIGRAPGDSAVQVARQDFTPTGVQTNFTFDAGYTPGYLDVYLNGSKLVVAQDFTATDGSVVGLTSAAASGDIIELVAFKAFNAASVNNAGTLTVSGNQTNNGTLSVTGGTTLSNLNVTGISTLGTVSSLDLNGGVLTLDADGDTTITADTDDQIDIAFGGNDRLTLSTGLIDLKNDGSQSAIRLYCESSNAHYAALQAPAHSAFSGNITLTLPATTDTLVARTTTDTLTNKTLTSPTISTPTLTGGVGIADSIFHTGDTNTQLRFPAADTFTVETGGSERLRVDSGGVVKVGSNTLVTPNTDADNFVIDTGDVDSGLSILSATTGRIYFGDAASNDQGSIRYVHSDDSMRFEANSSEALRIDSSQRLLIGTTTEGNGGADQVTISTSEHTGVTLRSGTTHQGNIFFSDGTTGDDEFRGIIRYDHNDNSMQLRTNATEALRVDSSQRLLMGETSDITGNTGAKIQISNSAGAIFVLNRNDTTVSNGNLIGDVKWFSNAGSANEEVARIRVDADGDQGSGDKPGRIEFHTTADSASSPTERLRITAAGRVSIQNDSGRFTAGTGDDLQIYHDGTDSFIDNSTNDLIIRSTGDDVIIRAADDVIIQTASSENAIVCNDNGGVDIYHNAVKKFETSSGGAAVTGTLNASGIITAEAGAVAEIGALSDGATITPDFATHCNFSVTLGGNRTLANPSNIVAGQSGSIFVSQDGTGSRTLSYGSNWDFAGGTPPTLSTAASAVDRIDYVVRTSTSIHAVATLAYS